MPPPKAKQPAPSKKTEQKKKEKIIVDKTFGLKNKKGAKTQKFIQQVEKQVKSGGAPPRKQAEEHGKKKEEKLKEAKELNQLFRPVQKVEKGADPKSVLCAFFKFGQCTKGSKCKFSHDLTVERKAEKRSLYVDMRDDDEDTMETWTEEKLKEVVEKKHGELNKKMPTTDIICKYFLEAVENSKYGWFWSCPNGGTCIYRHALPPGFVLKKDRKQVEKTDTISLEELIEKERSALTSTNSTKLTLETFLQWKKKKLMEKKKAKEKEEEKKRLNFKAGHHIGLSGRDMFSFNPELAMIDAYDDGDEAFDSYSRNDEEEEEGIRFVDLDVSALGFHIEEETETKPTNDKGDTNCNNEENSTDSAPINEQLFMQDLETEIDKEMEKCAISEEQPVN
ncbi:zinc finger CCCH domain-containing protein 15 homolog [Planococcus citri]|uniref:zinc finger CCCH domain-containing protein 15 homolog n=1 Tax=Planococcus citri TaxID=170843 RepID=UPI0031F876F6